MSAIVGGEEWGGDRGYRRKWVETVRKRMDTGLDGISGWVLDWVRGE